jgi:RNA polymerase sigma-70 factor, ECF subfamily
VERLFPELVGEAADASDVATFLTFAWKSTVWAVLPIVSAARGGAYSLKKYLEYDTGVAGLTPISPPADDRDKSGSQVHSSDPGQAHSSGSGQAGDVELVRKIKKGDKSAFAQLAAGHARSLFRLAYSLLGSVADAEDVVQETMLAAINQIHGFEGRSSVGTWLASILIFKASKVRRSRRVRWAVPIERAGEHALEQDARLHVAGATTAIDCRADVLAMLDTLSDEHRQVLVLREMQQMSYEQIGKILKVAPGTIMSRLHRARQHLKERFGEYAM